MASVSQNKINGKVISYKFKACVGRDEFGKQIFRCTTWKIPDNMIPSKAEKAAHKAAAEWELKVRSEYEMDLQNPERLKERMTANRRTDFADFILNTWFPICICDGQHKPTTIAFNRHISNSIANPALPRDPNSVTRRVKRFMKLHVIGNRSLLLVVRNMQGIDITAMRVRPNHGTRLASFHF